VYKPGIKCPYSDAVDRSSITVALSTHRTPGECHLGIAHNHPTIVEHYIDAAIDSTIGEALDGRVAGCRKLTDSSIVRHTGTHTHIYSHTLQTQAHHKQDTKYTHIITITTVNLAHLYRNLKHAKCAK